ncbi:MAG TPA: Bax inhibitor-1/YccA family protein [Stellaceae bacterium]|nr:Bax inhibitor-1/YccA family protein [Stellaceae bacterium]
MAFDRNNRWSAAGAIPQVDIDTGLRSYMLRVYNYMAGGLAVTGLVAYFAASSGLYLEIARTPLIWVVILAPLALVFLLSFGIERMSLGAAQLTYWVYSALVGLSLSWIFYRYVHTSIAEVFFITAGMFLGMSLYGYSTRRDLSRFGAFLFMGLIGIVIAGLVNLFLQSAAWQFVISVIGVVVFVGLTAWDTQRIKELYFAGDSAAVAGKKAIMGALTLYLDFINLFILLLRLFGDRRD